MSAKNLVSKIIYALKRQFPTELTFINSNPGEMNWDTQKQDSTEQRIVVKKAILMPTNLTRVAPVQYSYLEIGESVVLVDKKDLRSLVPSDQTIVLYDNKRWHPREILNLHDAAYQMIIREVEDE